MAQARTDIVSIDQQIGASKSPTAARFRIRLTRSAARARSMGNPYQYLNLRDPANLKRRAQGSQTCTRSTRISTCTAWSGRTQREAAHRRAKSRRHHPWSQRTLIGKAVDF